jgi:hypothetical protein
MKLAQKRKQANQLLSTIKVKNLQDWLDEAARLPGLEDALEGIFCGREGKIHEPLTGEYEGLYISMGWYTVSSNPKVEYAYVS